MEMKILKNLSCYEYDVKQRIFFELVNVSMNENDFQLRITIAWDGVIINIFCWLICANFKPLDRMRTVEYGEE